LEERRVVMKSVTYFKEFDWGYYLSLLMSFIYGSVILGYWVFLFIVVVFKILTAVKKKDPEAFKVVFKTIKFKCLSGSVACVDIGPGQHSQRISSCRGKSNEDR